MTYGGGAAKRPNGQQFPKRYIGGGKKGLVLFVLNSLAFLALWPLEREETALAG
jgi:hypothetical protein